MSIVESGLADDGKENCGNETVDILREEVTFFRKLVLEQGSYIQNLISIIQRGGMNFPRGGMNFPSVVKSCTPIGTIGQQIEKPATPTFPSTAHASHIDHLQQLPSQTMFSNMAREDNQQQRSCVEPPNENTFTFPKKYAANVPLQNSWSPDLRNSFAGLPIEGSLEGDYTRQVDFPPNQPLRGSVNVSSPKPSVYITEKEVVNSQAYRHRDARKKVTIIGDSLLHRAQKWRLNDQARNATIRKFTIPGYTARDLYSSIDAELTDPSLKADTVIINAGSNDLANDRFISPKEVADRVAALAKKCTDNGVTKIMISPITPRKGIEARRKETNRILRDICTEMGYTYINNSDISWNDLHTDKIHLNREGMLAMEDILISYINDDSDNYVNVDCLSVNNSSHG